MLLFFPQKFPNGFLISECDLINFQIEFSILVLCAQRNYFYEPAADVVGVDAVASFWIDVAIDVVIVVAEDSKDSIVEGTEESAIVAGSGKKVVESFVVAGFGSWVFGHLKKETNSVSNKTKRKKNIEKTNNENPNYHQSGLSCDFFCLSL